MSDATRPPETLADRDARVVFRQRPGGRTVDDEPARPVATALTVGRLLGRGGSSTVWQATDDSGRRFALKVPTTSCRAAPEQDALLPPTRRGRRAADAMLSSERAGTLARELALLHRFTHEHLLRVHRILPTSQGPALLMDLAAGGSLLALVTSRGPLPIPEVVTALVPIAQVLDHLHAAGAVHGDVTPGNILFTHEGKPLLADFGTARLLGSAGVDAPGTPGFLDPSRRAGFDSGADVFALAAVAWFAMTGRVPGPTEQRPPLSLILPDVPDPLVGLIEDGLSADRARRPTADRFARTLFAVSVAQPVDLVPAVHPSVLPELLTRRSPTPAGSGRPGRRPAPAPAGSTEVGPSGVRRSWRRLRARTQGTERSGTGRGSGGSPGRAAGRVVSGRGRARRGTTAMMAGLLAVVLLVAGLAMTLGGPRGPGMLPEARPGQSGGQDASAGRAGGGQGASADGTASDGGSGDDGTTTADPHASAEEASRSNDPSIALGGLASLRAEAFATADPSLLTTIDVEGSPAMAVDREAVEALVGSGRTLPDLTIAILDPAVLAGHERAALPALAALPAVSSAPASTQVALVRATAALSAYTEETTGSAYDPGPPPLMAAGRQDMIFVLWDSGEGWRIHSTITPPT